MFFDPGSSDPFYNINSGLDHPDPDTNPFKMTSALNQITHHSVGYWLCKEQQAEWLVKTWCFYLKRQKTTQ